MQEDESDNTFSAASTQSKQSRSDDEIFEWNKAIGHHLNKKRITDRRYAAVKKEKIRLNLDRFEKLQNCKKNCNSN